MNEPSPAPAEKALYPSEPAPSLPGDPSAPAPDALAEAAWVWTAPGKRTAADWAWFRLGFSRSDEDLPHRIRLSADSRYRLFVNGVWAGDGPVRGWPEHWYFDERDLTPLLRPGDNELLVLAQYYGCGTFHTIPQRPGFIAGLWRGDECLAATGGNGWEAAAAPEYRDAPEISVQMPPGEIYDARLASEKRWQAPVILPDAPWSGLRPRDVRDLALRPRAVPPPTEVRAVHLPAVRSVPLLRILHPETVLEADRKSRAFVLACEVEADREEVIPWTRGDFEVFVDGERLADDAWRATPGRHRILAVHPKVHDNTNAKTLGVPDHPALSFFDPLGADRDPPWRVLVHPDFHYCADDLHWIAHPSADLDESAVAWTAETERWGEAGKEEDAFRALVERFDFFVPESGLLQPDPDGEFKLREHGAALEIEPTADGAWRIEPPPGEAVELRIDLGDQVAGYHEIEITAAEGATIDLALIEHVRTDGVRQHTDDNWNGFRYVAREGRQRFVSRQRRSGRHLFLTVSRTDRPVLVHGLRVLETVFPVEAARFRCDDEELNRIWDAAVRTMELSCDDVYIDSLYEQTLWVGDARNEQLYGLAAWDARDLSLRSIRLAAQSLERLPMTGSQVPSGWFTIIPVWSFLWGISVWEYYAYSGEKEALAEFWNPVLKNLRGAAALLNERGLFEAPWWNLFEWAPSDFNHRTVLYNGMFFAGAVRAAIRCGEVLGAANDLPWLRTLEKRLVRAIRSAFDGGKGLFPEAFRRDGRPTETFSIHPQFLAVLFDIVEDEEERARLLDQVAADRDDLVGLASPFAFQFYAEAFEKAGREDHVLGRLRAFYRPMVETGTTLWEALPGSMTTPEGFPTRSHCHGWSSAPMDLLPRIVLGLRQSEPGRPVFVCSPQPHGLARAEGSRATPWGTIRVRWEREDGECRVALEHPEEIRVDLASNPWLEREAIQLRRSES